MDDWNGISPALVLYFDNNRPMPIREHKWDEYWGLINLKVGNNLIKKRKGIVMTIEQIEKINQNLAKFFVMCHGYENPEIEITYGNKEEKKGEGNE